MKYQRSSVSGLVIAIVFTIFFGITVLMILLTTGAVNQSQQQSSNPGVPIVVWVFIGVGYLLFMTIAFIAFIKGKKCEKIMKYGKKFPVL